MALHTLSALSRRLYLARAWRGVTREDLAMQVNIPHALLEQYETDAETIAYQDLMEISGVLQIDMLYFIVALPQNIGESL